jgi:hypothetical protein
MGEIMPKVNRNIVKKNFFQGAFGMQNALLDEIFGFCSCFKMIEL